MKIAFIGPESSGKTTLSKYFSSKYNAPLVEEFSREYLSKIQTNYAYSDLEIIAKTQFEQILNTSNSQLVFIDTDLVSMKVWSEFKYKKCCAFINENIKNQEIGLYFLCKADFPWEHDSLRENPNDLEELFDLFETILKEYRINYHILEGNLADRIEFCEKYIKK
ncbi:MAG: ATP-binding protein [Bacteroidota bacterium]